MGGDALVPERSAAMTKEPGRSGYRHISAASALGGHAEIVMENRVPGLVRWAGARLALEEFARCLVEKTVRSGHRPHKGRQIRCGADDARIPRRIAAPIGHVQRKSGHLLVSVSAFSAGRLMELIIRVIQMQRRQNAVPDLRRMVMSSDAVQNQPQENKLGVGIAESLARRKIGWLVICILQSPERSPVASPMHNARAELEPRVAGIIVDAARVPDEVPNGDAITVADVICNGCRQIIGNYFVGVEAAFDL